MIISRRHFASNAALSVAQVLVSGLLLFFLYRYLLKQIGSEQLGLWSVILASTSAARLSDLGMTGGVVKYVAAYRARGDLDLAARTVETTALSIALLMGILLIGAQHLFVFVLSRTIPAASLPLALEILPLAMFAFWGASIAGVFQASLDGCQQAGRRNVILMAGNLCFFICAICFVPRYGIRALAWSQIAQSGFLIIICWLVLRRYLPQLAAFPRRWSWKLFKEMFNYSANFQINSVAIMLCDPLTKILMSRFGGLSAAAYYEMAAQMVNKVRALMVSANQVVVPVVAEARERSPNSVREIYTRSYRLVFFVALPVYITLLLIVPLISYVWIGRFEDQFIAFACILAISNFVNNLGAPAYFDNLGTGKLAWNTIAHVSMAFFNAGLGTLLGYEIGAIGVAIAAGASILVGSLLVTAAVQRQYGLPLLGHIPKTDCPMALVLAAYGILGLVGTNYAHAVGLNTMAVSGVSLIGFMTVYSFTVRKHEYRFTVQRWIQRLVRKNAYASR